MKKLYTVFLAFVLLVAVAFGLYSLVDKDDEISTAENRGLTQKPKFTFSSFFSGDYMEELETYYTDQFPLRDKLMPLNKSLNKFYYYSGSGENNTLLIETTGNAGAGGIGGVQGETEEPQEPSAEPETPSETPGEQEPAAPETQEPETPEEPEEPVEEGPELDDPENA